MRELSAGRSNAFAVRESSMMIAIIFIAHSLGGLIVKEVRAAISRKIEYHRLGTFANMK
jgi:hypothetical protein